MSYREPQIRSSTGPLKGISWTLIVLGAVLLVFLTGHQIFMDSISREYGIEVPWVSQVLYWLAFVGLEAGALYAARRRYYGVSSGLSFFVVAFLGLFALFALAQVGM